MNRIFFSYAREDLENAQKIYRLLTENHFAVWMDEKELLPGQDWKLAVEKSIKTCNIFIACISSKSVLENDNLQPELRLAYEILDTLPERNIFIITVRLDDCNVPSWLQKIHQFDFFEPESKEKLIKVISVYVNTLAVKTSNKILSRPENNNIEEHTHEFGQEVKKRIVNNIAVNQVLDTSTYIEKSPSDFGKALKKAIANIAIHQDKGKQVVKHELGVLLGRSGDSIIEYWEKGHIPSKVGEMEKLAQILVKQRGITERTHLVKFLASSGYPNFSKFYNELFPELSQETPISLNTHQDWGEAPDPNNFFGRKQEILEIERLISLGGCRVVALLGIGGIGKTILAAKIAQQVSSQYDHLIWRSVREAPPLKTIIEELVRFLSHDEVEGLPSDTDAQIASLLGYLRKDRCLLILDNVESVIQVGSHAGFYREGYEGYGRFIQLIGETDHKSCLLLTSREKPKELTLWADSASAVQCCNLSGLELTDLQSILKNTSVYGSEKDWADAAQLYGGNPLAMKVMAGTIQNLFDGKLERFLAEGGVIFGDIRNVLNQQFERLTILEQNIMYWLAIEREPVSLEILSQDIHPRPSKGDLFDALDSLNRRSLVEKISAGFTLQNVVMEYITDRLVARCVDEINNHSTAILTHISLIKTTSRDYVRESQLRLIVKPVIDALVVLHGLQPTETLLKERLERLSKSYQQKPGYNAGNLVTLLSNMDASFYGCNFSNLTIWEADFQNIDLENTNFSYATFSRCNFTQIFGLIVCVAFNPSGEYIAAGTSSGDILLWELKTRQLVLTFRGHTDWVRTLCFSENGLELFSASDDQTVRMWNSKTGYPLRLFPGHVGRVFAVAVDSEKQIMVSGGEDTFIRVWDIPTGNCIKEFKGHEKWIFSLNFSPDKQLLLSASSDNTLKLWATASYTCTRTLRGHRSYVWTAAFSKDGSFIASGGNDGTVRIWRGRDGNLIRTINIPETQVRRLAIDPKGNRVATAHSDSHFLRIWDVNTGQQIKVLTGHETTLSTVAFSPTGDWLASGSAGSLRVWSAQDLGSIFSYKGYSIGIASMAFSPIDADVLLSTHNDGVARQWNIKTGQNRTIFKKVGQSVWKAIFNPTATIIACSFGGGLVHLLDAQSKKILKSFKENAKSFGITGFSPDGQTLITCGNIASIWDINTNSLLATLPIGFETYSFAFEPQKQWLLFAGENGPIHCWDINRKELLHILEGHAATVWSLSFNQKTKQLVSASSDHTIRLWDLEKMEQIAILKGHENQVKTVSFSPNGQHIASGCYDGKICIWDAQSLRCLHVLEEHTDVVWNVAFNCDGQILASGSRDGTIRIWDALSFECINVLRPNRPYEKMNITKTVGLNETQKENLILLGAIDDESFTR